MKTNKSAVTGEGNAPSIIRYGVEHHSRQVTYFPDLESAKAFAKSGKAGNPRFARAFSQAGSWQRNYNV